MFNSGWAPGEAHELPELPKKEVRYSPKIIAAIRGRPLEDHTRERVFDDELPARSFAVKKSKPKKAMKEAIAEVPVMEAGKAPEGIQSTKNYSLFALLPTNRPVDKAHVKTLAAAIRKKNLLHLNPIVVNGNMEVIDGQHRLEAAKLLGCTIFFAQDVEVSQDDIAGMNSNKKNWLMMDYIHFYAEKGDAAYISFQELCKRNPKFLPGTLLNMCVNDKKSYKEGVLDMSKLDQAEQTILYITEMAEYTDQAFTSRFVEAVSFMNRSGEYDHARMIGKLQKVAGAIQPCANTRQYIQMLQGIYNRGAHDANLVVFLKR